MLQTPGFYVRVAPHMTTTAITFTPVNVEARKKLGIKSGDTVRVYQKIEEKGKIRLQMFEGLVLSVKHGTEPGATFTVRKVSSGVGVERTFPLYSPVIDRIEIVRESKSRRSKLYYIRDKAAKEIRSKIKQTMIGGASTADIEAEINKRAEEEAKANEPEKAAGESAEATEQVAESSEEAKEENTEEAK